MRWLCFFVFFFLLKYLLVLHLSDCNLTIHLWDTKGMLTLPNWCNDYLPSSKVATTWWFLWSWSSRFVFAIDQIKLTLNESRRHFMYILLCCDMQRCVQFVWRRTSGSFVGFHQKWDGLKRQRCVNPWENNSNKGWVSEGLKPDIIVMQRSVQFVWLRLDELSLQVKQIFCDLLRFQS